jgi:hypothetical protein
VTRLATLAGDLLHLLLGAVGEVSGVGVAAHVAGFSCCENWGAGVEVSFGLKLVDLSEHALFLFSCAWKGESWPYIFELRARPFFRSCHASRAFS